MKISIIIGAGFSKDAGLPLASEINDQLCSVSEDSILQFSSGELKWKDKAEETDRHNGTINWDHFITGISISQLVAYYRQSQGNIFSYEEFYQWLNDDYESIHQVVSEETRKRLIEKLGCFPKIEDLLYYFDHRPKNELIDHINLLIADLLEIRNNGNEQVIVEQYSRFLSFLQKGQINVFSLNHDMLLEGLFRSSNIAFDTGFSTDKSPIVCEDTPLQVYRGFSNSRVNLFKLHGSIDLYKFIKHEKDENSHVLYQTTQYYYFKTREYRAKHYACLIDVESGNIIQEINFDIVPKFLTGTQKQILIDEDLMYSEIYREFSRRTRDAEILIIIGYSFSDEHINSVIKGLSSSLQRIIHINPSMEFPYTAYFPNANIENFESLLQFPEA